MKIMSEDILKKICDYVPTMPEPHNKPFIYSSYKYYINNHFGLRIPSTMQNDITDNPLTRKIRDQFKYSKFNGGNVITDNDYALIMKEFPVCQECDPCLNDPALIKCEECDGDGEVHLGNDYNDYECTCKSCDGNGVRKRRKGRYTRNECPKCGGSGIYSDKQLALPIDEHYINPVIIGFLISIFGKITVFDPKDNVHIFYSVQDSDIEGMIGILNLHIGDRENNYYKIINPLSQDQPIAVEGK